MGRQTISIATYTQEDIEDLIKQDLCKSGLYVPEEILSNPLDVFFTSSDSIENDASEAGVESGDSNGAATQAPRRRRRRKAGIAVTPQYSIERNIRWNSQEPVSVVVLAMQGAVTADAVAATAGNAVTKHTYFDSDNGSVGVASAADSREAHNENEETEEQAFDWDTLRRAQTGDFKKGDEVDIDVNAVQRPIPLNLTEIKDTLTTLRPQMSPEDYASFEQALMREYEAAKKMAEDSARRAAFGFNA